MLRGLAQSGKGWPFASADSVNVARNYKDKKTCPEKMARAIDSVQCPIKWEHKPEQQSLLGGLNEQSNTGGHRGHPKDSGMSTAAKGC